MQKKRYTKNIGILVSNETIRSAGQSDRRTRNNDLKIHPPAD